MKKNIILAVTALAAASGAEAATHKYIEVQPVYGPAKVQMEFPFRWTQHDSHSENYVKVSASALEKYSVPAMKKNLSWVDRFATAKPKRSFAYQIYGQCQNILENGSKAKNIHNQQWKFLPYKQVKVFCKAPEVQTVYKQMTFKKTSSFKKFVNVKKTSYKPFASYQNFHTLRSFSLPVWKKWYKLFTVKKPMQQAKVFLPYFKKTKKQWKVIAKQNNFDLFNFVRFQETSNFVTYIPAGCNVCYSTDLPFLPRQCRSCFQSLKWKKVEDFVLQEEQWDVFQKLPIYTPFLNSFNYIPVTTTVVTAAPLGINLNHSFAWKQVLARQQADMDMNYKFIDAAYNHGRGPLSKTQHDDLQSQLDALKAQLIVRQQIQEAGVWTDLNGQGQGMSWGEYNAVVRNALFELKQYMSAPWAVQYQNPSWDLCLFRNDIKVLGGQYSYSHSSSHYTQSRNWFSQSVTTQMSFSANYYVNQRFTTPVFGRFFHAQQAAERRHYFVDSRREIPAPFRRWNLQNLFYGGYVHVHRPTRPVITRPPTKPNVVETTEGYCTICMEDKKDMVTMPCHKDHKFCKKCANDLINHDIRKCPLCRKAWRDADLKKLGLGEGGNAVYVPAAQPEEEKLSELERQQIEEATRLSLAAEEERKAEVERQRTIEAQRIERERQALAVEEERKAEAERQRTLYAQRIEEATRQSLIDEERKRAERESEVERMRQLEEKMQAEQREYERQIEEAKRLSLEDATKDDAKIAKMTGQFPKLAMDKVKQIVKLMGADNKDDDAKIAKLMQQFDNLKIEQAKKIVKLMEVQNVTAASEDAKVSFDDDSKDMKAKRLTLGMKAMFVLEDAEWNLQEAVERVLRAAAEQQQ